MHVPIWVGTLNPPTPCTFGGGGSPNNRFSRSRWIGSELRICWIVAARTAAQFSLRRCRRHSRQRRWRQIRFDPQICEKLLNLLVEIRLWRRENFKNGHRKNRQFWGDFDGKSWVKKSLKNTLKLASMAILHLWPTFCTEGSKWEKLGGMVKYISRFCLTVCLQKCIKCYQWFQIERSRELNSGNAQFLFWECQHFTNVVFWAINKYMYKNTEQLSFQK